MAQKEKVVLFSAFGRAHWLAKELSSWGYQTTLVDYTEKLGYRSPDVWEPPFGFFESKQMNNSQSSWLSDSYSMTEVKSGFTILTQNGPIELQGDLRKSFLKQLNLNSDNLTNLKSGSFNSNWCVYLAHQIASTRFTHNYLALDENKNPLPILDPLKTRVMTRRSYESEIEALVDRGVEFIRSNELGNIEEQSGAVASVAVSGAKIGSDRFLWFLSSEELTFLNQTLASKLLESPAIKAEWYWTKYRIIVNSEWIYETLPSSFVMLEDPALPWAHEKLLVMQKGSMKGELQCWVRIPTSSRFTASYHDNMSTKISKLVESRFPHSKVTDFEMPFEYKTKQGPPALPVYSSEDSRKFKARTFSNFVWLGPELWDRLDWEFQLQFQNKAFKQIREVQLKKETMRRRGRDLEIYS